MIIVNNNSTDGTRLFLDQWEEICKAPFEKIVIHTESNFGGAGGFYIGEKKALELDSDWVFVADDDAYPHKDMIEKFYEYESTHDCSNVSAICSAVYEMNGSVALYHRYNSKIRGFNVMSSYVSLENYEKESFEFDLLTYVGPFINANALKKVGLINPRYFIYSDDTEHSMRLKKYGKLICVPSIKIEHEGILSKIDGNSEDVSWREYYSLRNHLNTMKRHHILVFIYCFLAQFRRLYLTKRDNPKRKHLLKTALWNSIFNKLGIHDVYKPGWK